MSRSLVGSSSSSTFGSPASSRSICSRRRSPPDRSPTGVQSRRSVKPNTSASWAAESSRSPSLTRRATSSTASSTPQVTGQLGQLLGQERRPHGRAGDAAARRRARVTPASSRSRVVLPAPLRAEDARSGRPGRPARSASSQDRLRAGVQRDVLQVVDLLAEPGGGQPLQRHRVAGRRHVGDERVGGVDAELRLGGAGRRAAAQPGDLLAEQVLPAGLGRGGDPLPLGAGQGPGGEAALVRPDRSGRRPPRWWCRPRRGTTGRG